jgi:hypothetical protein
MKTAPMACVLLLALTGCPGKTAPPVTTSKTGSPETEAKTETSPTAEAVKDPTASLGYLHSKLAKLKLGSTKAEVKAVLGMPKPYWNKSSAEVSYWGYSLVLEETRFPATKAFGRMLQFIFDAKGEVISIRGALLARRYGLYVGALEAESLQALEPLSRRGYVLEPKFTNFGNACVKCTKRQPTLGISVCTLCRGDVRPSPPPQSALIGLTIKLP